MIVTFEPTLALKGDTEAMLGTGTTASLVLALTLPPGLVTVTVELAAAPTGMVKTNCVAELLSGVTVTAPTLTELTSARPVPVKVTDIPGEPLSGLMELTVGAGTKVKFPAVV